MIRKFQYKEKAELPYNPNDVNVRLQHFRVRDLLAMIDHGELAMLHREDQVSRPRFMEQLSLFEDLNFQRKPGLWNVVQKSLFIESLMINLPIPLFYFDGSKKPWGIIDGLQRLFTIHTFVKNNYKLGGLEYLNREGSGRFFDQLDGYLKSRILDAEIEAYVINPGTPSEVKYNIFKRINTGGLKLNGQEIRNAFCRGFPANFTQSLSMLDEFQKVTGGRVSSRRMEDREYALRFVAFQIFDYHDYIAKMDIFLTQAMVDLYDLTDHEKLELEESFILSCRRIYNVLGENAFLRIRKDNSLGKRPNKALFDALSWNFSRISETEYSKILNSKNEFVSYYKEFMIKDDMLYSAISDTTGTKTAVKNRFDRMKYFINQFINDNKIKFGEF